MPIAGEPISSISSAASPSVLTIDQSSIPSRWNGSSAMRRPSRSASAPISRRPATTVARSPGPVTQTIPVGPNSASRRSEARIASMRSRGSSGPGSSGSGWTDGMAGTALAAPSPLARKRSSESSSSLDSQMPMPSAPASR